MPSASVFLLGGLALAIALGAIVWWRARHPVSPSRSVEEFRGAMRAIRPERRRRGR